MSVEKETELRVLRSMMSWILILQLELFPLHCITKLFYC